MSWAPARQPAGGRRRVGRYARGVPSGRGGRAVASRRGCAGPTGPSDKDAPSRAPSGRTAGGRCRGPAGHTAGGRAADGRQRRTGVPCAARRRGRPRMRDEQSAAGQVWGRCWRACAAGGGRRTVSAPAGADTRPREATAPHGPVVRKEAPPAGDAAGGRGPGKKFAPHVRAGRRGRPTPGRATVFGQERRAEIVTRGEAPTPGTSPVTRVTCQRDFPPPDTAKRPARCPGTQRPGQEHGVPGPGAVTPAGAGARAVVRTRGPSVPGARAVRGGPGQFVPAEQFQHLGDGLGAVEGGQTAQQPGALAGQQGRVGVADTGPVVDDGEKP